MAELREVCKICFGSTSHKPNINARVESNVRRFDREEEMLSLPPRIGTY